VEGVDIRPFIGDLPGGRDTAAFRSDDASGSTSQAANIQAGIGRRAGGAWGGGGAFGAALRERWVAMVLCGQRSGPAFLSREDGGLRTLSFGTARLREDPHMRASFRATPQAPKRSFNPFPAHAHAHMSTTLLQPPHTRACAYAYIYMYINIVYTHILITRCIRRVSSTPGGARGRVPPAAAGRGHLRHKFDGQGRPHGRPGGAGANHAADSAHRVRLWRVCWV
jgi:hypothetical protein